MKCYRLRPDSDIKEGKIYVGGTKATTLEKELKVKEEAEMNAGILPGDLQRWLSSSLGFVLAVRSERCRAFADWS
jgi:hypothetical protein